MLQKVDRMTMANSVEGRVPFAAPSVLGLAKRLRFKYLVRDGVLKWALRGAFADDLPTDIVNRPKHGFNVPLDHWFRTDWRDLISKTFSSGSSLMKHGIIDAKSGTFAEKLVADAVGVHGQTLFAFVILDYWLSQNPGVTIA
jgi:asparagine synthase (glutamine-hydrolysing)